MKSEDKRELSEENQGKVSGGNYGDTEAEKEGLPWGQVNFMYNIGDVVEVYQYKVHISDWGTRRGTIVGRHVYCDARSGDWEGSYDVLYDGESTPTNYVSADDILRH